MSRWMSPWGVGGGQPLRDLPADPQHPGERQRGAPAQPLLQALALEELHGEVGDVLVLADLVDGDDVVVLEGGAGPGLAEEALAGHRVAGELRQDHLQGHGAAEVRVLGPVDDAHAPAPQFLLDGVRADLPRQRRGGDPRPGGGRVSVSGRPY